jgi:transcriptional regulator with XRE-family HTH domain
MEKLKIVEEFRFRLDKALALRNMKARDLVKATGISESAISQYRKGLTEPKRDRLVQIANALQVNASWLMGLDVPMEEPTFIPWSVLTNPTEEESELIDLYRCLSKDDKEQVSSLLKRLYAYQQRYNELLKKKEGDDSETSE